MRFLGRHGLALAMLWGGLAMTRPAFGDGDIGKVKHVIVVMQENHSFDNYFGALAYAPGSPYHQRLEGCRKKITPASMG
jgi:phospholipase C